MGITLAEKSFRTKLKALTATDNYLHGVTFQLFDEPYDLEVHVRHHKVEEYDAPEVERIFNQYGSYLELIGGDATIEDESAIAYIYEWTRRVPDYPPDSMEDEPVDLEPYFTEDRELSMRDEPDSMDYLLDSGMPPVPSEEPHIITGQSGPDLEWPR